MGSMEAAKGWGCTEAGGRGCTGVDADGAVESYCVEWESTGW